jgi:microcompartment protein CcmK/EutM
VERSSNSSFDADSQGGSQNTSLTELDSALNSCKLVIVQVYNAYNDTSGSQHWVLVTKKNGTGNYSIIDPGYSARNLLSAYNNKFWRYITIGKR